MHSLVGTFIKDLPDEQSGQLQHTLYPLKIILPPNKSRILYFWTKIDQEKWLHLIKEAVGYANLFDFYTLDKTLGSGQFGLVKLAIHNKTGT